MQPVPTAKFLDCILYSREQLVKEYQAMPEKGNPEDLLQVHCQPQNAAADPFHLPDYILYMLMTH